MTELRAVPPLPLEGVTVLEVASWVAAPSAGALLADLGADVIKVEAVTGDPVRGMMRQPRLPSGEQPTIDYCFQADNRGKRGIAVRVDVPDGIDVVHRLVARSDVFLCNLLPHRQTKFGLDPQSVFAFNRRAVHATLTGYGLAGPDALRPGFDVTTFFGRGAVLDALTEPDAVPPNPRPAQGDHAAGLAMTVAVLAALRLAETTDQGQVVDVSLLGTAAWTMTSDLAAALIDGRSPSKKSRHQMITPLTNRYRCSDGRWFIFNMPEARWWPVVCQAVGERDLVDDPRYESVRDRYQRIHELVEHFDSVFAKRDLQDWAQVFDEHGLIWGPLATIAELASDPQAEVDGLFPVITHPGGDFRTIASPVRIHGVHVAPRHRAPEIGEHTEEVLAEVGIASDRVQELRSSGVVA